MAIFSNAFEGSSSIEERLKAEYELHLVSMGVPPQLAKRSAGELATQAKEESIKEGTWSLPEDYGDILLERESTDEEIGTMLARKRREGVTDEDIRRWWNVHDLGRRMILKLDELNRANSYTIALAQEGITPDEAATWVRKFFAIYGEPGDMPEATGDDKPLPCELKDRVRRYVERRAATEPKEYRKDIQNSSTFNALVRKEVRAGNI
ncbi:MAG: hypothetical protein ACE5JA_09170 [bacterium]